MDALGSALNGLEMARLLAEDSAVRISAGQITPEVVSNRTQAETQINVQTQMIKEALAAESQVLDLLV